MATISSSTAPSAKSQSLTSAPDTDLVLFARGVIARLNIWPTLRLAVDQVWGGPESVQKRTWMASVIVDAFDPSESPEIPDVFYLEDMLLQIMADEFDTILEDDSAEAVAKDILFLWSSLKDGTAQQIANEWENQNQKIKGVAVKSQEIVDDNGEFSGDDSGSNQDEDEEMVVDPAPQLIDRESSNRSNEPIIDDDGFTLVKGKGKGHK